MLRRDIQRSSKFYYLIIAILFTMMYFVNPSVTLAETTNITNVQSTYSSNWRLLSLTITAVDSVGTVKVTVNGGTSDTAKYSGNNLYEWSKVNLDFGSQITITAYDLYDTLIETSTYTLDQTGNLIDAVTDQGSIVSIILDQESQIAGSSQTLAATITTLGITDNSSVEIELVNSDGSSLSPVLSSTGTTNQNTSVINLQVPNSLVSGIYKLKVTIGTIVDTSTSYLIQNKYGDINNDGIIDVNDVVLVMKEIVGTYSFSESQNVAANVNGDTVVDVNDVVQIMRYIVGTLPKFPVEQ